MPTVEDALALLRADGWTEVKRRAGSHRQFRHSQKPGRVTLPDHGRLNERLSPGTWKSILKQLGRRRDG
jgi:predicted RNA binding protein YcfA (HicA-like mRNA interferase family)